MNLCGCNVDSRTLLRDVLVWNRHGLWTVGAPKWAVAVSDRLGVDAGNVLVYLTALEALLGLPFKSGMRDHLWD
jgi:hypothetical protein